jgi:hypothetical protein
MPCSDAIQRTALGRHAGARADSERLTDQQRNRERGRAVLLLIQHRPIAAIAMLRIGDPRGSVTRSGKCFGATARPPAWPPMKVRPHWGRMAIRTHRSRKPRPRCNGRMEVDGKLVR